nr:calcium-binding protein 4-like [Caretta caretta]
MAKNKPPSIYLTSAGAAAGAGSLPAGDTAPGSRCRTQTPRNGRGRNSRGLAHARRAGAAGPRAGTGAADGASSTSPPPGAPGPDGAPPPAHRGGGSTSRCRAAPDNRPRQRS